MKLRTINLLPIVGMLFFATCADAAPDMKAGFAAEVPKGWTLESFKITVSEDVGTKVSPVSHHRFVAKVSPTEDLFKQVATLLGKNVLKRVYEKGNDVEVHGIGIAAFFAGKWDTHYQIEASPFFKGGQPAKSFGGDQVVVGSSDFRSLVTLAKSTLEKLRDQSGRLSGEVRQKMAGLQMVSAEAQTKIAQAGELVARVQQETRTRQSGEYQTYNQKVQEIRNKYTGEFNTKRAALSAVYNEKKAALDAKHTATINQVRAERTEAGAVRRAERTRVQTEVNATIGEARRKRLDPASLATIKSSAEAKARADYSAIDEEARVKTEVTREREAKEVADYRAQVSALQKENQSAVAKMSDEVNATRDAELAAEKRKYDEAVGAASTELADAQKTYNALTQSTNERRRQMGFEIDGIRNQLNNNDKNIQSLEEVLAHLESSTN